MAAFVNVPVTGSIVKIRRPDTLLNEFSKKNGY
jgi:hypothetical protein